MQARLELDAQPDLPWHWQYLWQWWQELAAGRQGAGMGVSGLSWAEMDAWARRTDRQPTVQEWTLLRRIDCMFIEANQRDHD